MNIPFTDPHVTTLYFIVRDEEEPMISESRRDAISLLADLAGKGNREAERAMKMLVATPRLHPLLRKQLEELMIRD